MKKILSLALSTGISYSVIILTLTAALLMSCSKVRQDPSSGLTGGESPVKVTLNAGTFASSPADGGDMDEQSNTKALPAGMKEDDMANIWVMQFNAGGACVKSQYFASYNPSDFVVTLANGTAQTVAFVANTFDANLFKGYAKTWTDFQTESKAVAENGLYTGSGADKYLIITGIFKGNITAAGLPAAVQMKRAVAKVNLAWSSAVPATDLFTMKSIRICRVPNKQAYTEPTSNTYPAWAAVNDSILYPEVTNPTAAGTHSWYLTENARGTGTGSTTFDKSNRTAPAGQAAYCTYINVQGDYTFDNSGANVAKKQTVSLSYKFYLGADMISDYNVLRNNIYNLTVRFTGANAADARISVISGGGNYSVDEGWGNPDDPNQDANFGDGSDGVPVPPVIPDPPILVPVDPANCYMMASGQTLTYDARVQGNGAAGAVPMNTASVGILWQTGNGVTPLVESVAFSDGLATVATTSGMSGSAVVAAYSGANRTGTILWSWHIWVTDYKPSEAGYATRTANTAYNVTGGQVHTYGTKFLAKNPGKVIMDRDLGTTSGIYAPPADATAAVKALGCFYQWGRKDPAPRWSGVCSGTDYAAKIINIYAANGTTDVTTTAFKTTNGSVSVATAVANPGIFYAGESSNNNDWTTPQNGALWGNGAAKSIYDPCPQGWRIAPDGTWSDFGTNAYAAPFFYYINGVKQDVMGRPKFVESVRNGRLYEAGNVKAWYPSSGVISFGSLTNEGDNGFRWSSAVSGANAMYLSFDSAYLSPSNTCIRNYGCPVRCVQE